MSIDLVVLRVTSRTRDSMWESDIFKDNIEEGNLDIEPSYVKVDSIYTVEKSIVRKVAARLNEEKIMEIKKLISKLFSLTLF